MQVWVSELDSNFLEELIWSKVDGSRTLYSDTMWRKFFLLPAVWFIYWLLGGFQFIIGHFPQSLYSFTYFPSGLLTFCTLSVYSWSTTGEIFAKTFVTWADSSSPQLVSPRANLEPLLELFHWFCLQCCSKIPFWAVSEHTFRHCEGKTGPRELKNLDASHCREQFPTFRE